jgi:peroxiredoxin
MAIAADKAEEGKPAPMVELSAASKAKGAKVNLSDFKGKKNVVLFFYPKAMTGG